MRKLIGGRRLLTAVITAVSLTAPIALTTQITAADPLNVGDLGVELQVAQATAAPSGETQITWQNSADVRAGTGTALRARIYNAGSLPQSSVVLNINTGSRVDPDFDLANGCSVSAGLLADTVSCAVGSLSAGQSSPWFDVAVDTPLLGITFHSTSGTAFPGELISLPLAQEAPDSGSATTSASPTSGYAVLTDGESATYNDSQVNETFAVPEGTTNGGAVFVHLYRGDGSDSTCGTGPCYGPEARADFVQIGGTTASAENPFVMEVVYPKQSCAGIGSGSSCNPIYHQKTATTSGPAVLTSNCVNYHPNGAVSDVDANPDPCVYGRPVVGGNIRFKIALYTDIGFPIPGLL